MLYWCFKGDIPVCWVDHFTRSFSNDRRSSIIFKRSSIAIGIDDRDRAHHCRYSNSLSCLIGWRKNVVCLLDLIRHLKEEYLIDGLSMHNCTQDGVENFFARIRSGGGNRDNPSALEFAAEYRKITVDSLFDTVRGSNCNLDAGEFLVKLNQLQAEQP